MLFFISLGLIPEVIFANVPFKSKKNIFLSFYKMKLIIQPYILLVLIIYYLLFILCLGNGKTQKEKIGNEIKSIKKAINGFVDKNIFVWNNFDEKDILIEEKKRKEEEMKKEEENKNKNKKEESLKKDAQPKRRKTMANFGTSNRLGIVQRKKRKESQDENEDKSKHQKLLGIKEDEDEDDENKEKIGILTKIGNKIEIAKLFLVNNIFIRMKKYIIFGIILIILLSPVINGIFGYGYYVFYDSQVDYCFQIDLALCFVYGFTLILLTNE